MHLFAPDSRTFVQQHLADDRRLKHFTHDHIVNGVVDARGEDSGDIWRITAAENVVTTRSARIVYPDDDLISIEQLNRWAGRQLSDDDLVRLRRAIPGSSVPDAINEILAGFDD